MTTPPVSALPPSLLGLTGAEIAPLLAGLPDVRRFTGAEISRWLFERRVSSFEEMTSLPKGLRAALAERYRVAPLEVSGVEEGEDGTRKYLFRCADGAKIEAVDIAEDERTTYCLSSQAGCAADCSFCVTGRLGPGRNLSAGEILGQYVEMRRRGDDRATDRVNVVFMGMGEPTANLDAVKRACERLSTEISPRRITISTVGNVPGIDAIASWTKRPNLAVSVNAGDDTLRSKLMPINRAWPLAELHRALARFPLEPRRRITAEYVLIGGVNDSTSDAERFADFLRGLEVKANLIPLNEDRTWLPGMKRPSEETIDAFCRVLMRRRVTVTVRRSKGRSASAACGQLKGSETPARKRK